jgi:DNA-binding NarL/FixJ family response regulator
MRCLIVDDSVEFAEAARALFDSEGFTVVGVALNSVDALRLFEELDPEVTLVDVNLGRDSGFELVRQLHLARSSGSSPVILISTRAEQDFTKAIATSQAIGFLSKSNLTPRAVRDLVERSTRLQEGDGC